MESPPTSTYWEYKPCPLARIIVAVDCGITSAKARVLGMFEYPLSEIQEIGTWPGYDTDVQSLGEQRRVHGIMYGVGMQFEDVLADARAARNAPSQLSYHKERELSRWGRGIEPVQSWPWTKILLSPTRIHSQDPPKELNSEQIAQRYLQALYQSISGTSRDISKDSDRIGKEIGLILHDLGPIWTKHYREVERYSHTLPAMLDNCLQIWAQQLMDEKDDGCVDQDTQKRRIPLHFCSALGFDRLGEVYLQMGADPNVLAYPGQSALQLAAAGGHTRMIELLLDRDADIEQRTLLTGRSTLQLAAFWGHEEAVKFLLKEGADVQVKDKWGYTALALANVNGHERVAKLLRAFDGSDLAYLGRWEREGASMDEGDGFLHPGSNHGNMSDRTSPLFTCPFGEVCTSGSSPFSRHQDLLRHTREKHPAPGAHPNGRDEHQRKVGSCWQCHTCLQCHRRDDQPRCSDCGGPARSNEVDEGWIAVDHQECSHCTWKGCNCTSEKCGHSTCQNYVLA